MRLFSNVLGRKVLGGFLLGVMLACIIPTTTWAANFYNNGGTVVYSNAGDLKSIISADSINTIMNESAAYIEVVICSDDGTIIGNPYWIDKNQASWDIMNPQQAGQFTAKLYLTKSKIEAPHLMGGATPVAAATYTVGQMSEGNMAATSEIVDGKQYVHVELSNMISTYGIALVRFHFWNESNIDVYSVDAVADQVNYGRYTATVASELLNPKYGNYKITCEVIDINQINVPVTTSAEVTLAAAVTTVKAQDVDKKNGTFSFVTGQIFSAEKIEAVSFKVWNEDETKAHTYKGKKQKDGSYKALVEASKHDYYSGKYNVSVIVKLTDNNKSIAASGSKKFDLTNFIVYGKTNKKFIKKIYIYNPSIKKNAYAAIWTKAGKGEDKEVYKAKYTDGHLEITATMSKLKEAGTAYVLLMKKKKSGYADIKKYTFEVKKAEIVKTGWSYSRCANGKVYKFYYREGKRVNNLTKILKIRKEEKRYIEVNRLKNRVTVYAYDEETKSYCIPVICFKCSVGKASTPTPRGTYKTDRKHRWKCLMGPSWGQYATHIMGGIYFHSVAGSTTNSYGITASAYNRLGGPASHGCIRLTVRDAKWIYDYASLKTTVKIFDSEYAGPLKPQYVPKISANQHYDPTDPAVKKK